MVYYGRITGRGANGKSVLSSYDKYVWGSEICGAIGMSALQQQGCANNDFIYKNRNTRSVAVVENSDSRQMCEVQSRFCVAHSLTIK